MAIKIGDFEPPKDKPLNLSAWPTQIDPCYSSDEHYNQLLAQHSAQLDARQEMLYTSAHEALLVIFQGMDAAGKDSAVKHVMSGVNPQGCRVTSFKTPTTIELHHDFLWRAALALPARGEIGIFNRSYYEDVLITRVHPELLTGEGASPEARKKLWAERYQSIVDFEQHLARNNTRILKFYLHLSREEQKKRFLKRLDEPDKTWKIQMADVEERAYWKDYKQAYEDAIGATNTKSAPWFIVPADDKKNARLIIAQAIVDTLNAMDMKPAPIDDKRRAELQTIRERLEAEKS